jgi:hypothetical protein
MFGRGGGVEGPGEGASDEVDDAGDGEEKERTSATGLRLKRARRSLLTAIV